MIWSTLVENWRTPLAYSEENKRRYRNLILALGRKRDPNYRAHFIKFTSNNVLFLDFVRFVFPDVPVIFLYRHPVEVMVAYAGQGPGWGRFKDSELGGFFAGCSLEAVRAMSRSLFHESFLSRFLVAALASAPEGLTVANYNRLNRDQLGSFLRAFNYAVDADTLALMGGNLTFTPRMMTRGRGSCRTRRRNDVTSHPR